MVKLYGEIILLHEVVVPLVGIQKKAQEVFKLLKVANKVVDQIQECNAKYIDVPQQLVINNRVFVEESIVQIRLHHQNYIRLGEQLTNTIFAYNRLHNGLESLIKKHMMP